MIAMILKIEISAFPRFEDACALRPAAGNLAARQTGDCCAPCAKLWEATSRWDMRH